MGFESPSMESGEGQKLFSEKGIYENELQAGINKENSIRARYGTEVNSEDAQREIAEAQREQAMAQRKIDDVNNRLRTAK